MDPRQDLEKAQQKVLNEPTSEDVVVEGGESKKPLPLWRWMAKYGVEVRGIDPVPAAERVKTNYHSIFFMWMAILCNLLPIVTGMAGTLSFELSVRDTSLVIIFFNLLCCILTAWLGTLGPRTGMRQVIQARYSFGPYCVSIVALLNLISIVGFTTIAIVISGQTLSAVSDGKMTISVGIVLTGLLGMIVSFCGYGFLHMFNDYSWVVTIIAVVIAVGCGGHHLTETVHTEPATASTILTFGSLIAGFMLPFAGIMSDFAVYYSPAAPPKKMFWYVYISQNLSTIFLQILGAAIGAAVPNVESWNAGYNAYSAGGVLEAMLRPAKGFGKFVAVLLAFSLIGNVAASMYSIALNFQAFASPLASVPRSVYTIVTTAIMIPVGIKAAESFFNSLENFLSIVSYWPGAFGAIVSLEHFWFRKGDLKTYDQAAWKDRKRLPPGIAAISAGILSFAIIVPCMDTAWFVGPIAKATGDIGFETGFVLTGLLYIPFRTLELRMFGR